MNVDLSRVVGSLEAGRERRDGLQGIEHATFRIVGKGVNRGTQFVDDVGELAVGCKGNMARTGAGFDLRVGGVFGVNDPWLASKR